MNQDDDLTRYRVAWRRDRNFLKGCGSLALLPMTFFALAAAFGDLPAFWAGVMLIAIGVVSFGLVHLIVCPRCGRRLQWRNNSGNLTAPHCLYCGLGSGHRGGETG